MKKNIMNCCCCCLLSGHWHQCWLTELEQVQQRTKRLVTTQPLLHYKQFGLIRSDKSAALQFGCRQNFAIFSFALDPVLSWLWLKRISDSIYLSVGQSVGLLVKISWCCLWSSHTHTQSIDALEPMDRRFVFEHLSSQSGQPWIMMNQRLFYLVVASHSMPTQLLMWKCHTANDNQELFVVCVCVSEKEGTFSRRTVSCWAGIKCPVRTIDDLSQPDDLTIRWSHHRTIWRVPHKLNRITCCPAKEASRFFFFSLSGCLVSRNTKQRVCGTATQRQTRT